MSKPILNNYKAKLFALVPIIFFSVSGGPYGLEEIVSSVGSRVTLFLLLVVPIIWTIPECLIVSELSSNYPVQGGYYKWVQMTMGRFWGFMEGYWSILYNLIDLSLYPVLFTTYLKILYPDLNNIILYLVNLFVIWTSVFINIKGVKFVGFSLGFFKSFILIAFLFFIVLGLFHINFDFSPLFSQKSSFTPKHLIYGLSLAFWNFIGWDNATPVLEEIHDSHNTYYKAVFLTIPIIVFFYFFPVLIGVCIHSDSASWKFGEFSLIANTMGFPLLSTFLTVGGMVMCLGIFNSLMLSSTRILSTMSNDSLLPKSFSSLHPIYKTPYFAVLFSGIVYSILVLFDFENLIVFDVFFYLIAMFLEILALVIFRRRNVIQKDTFIIPFGNFGMYFIVILASLVILSMTIFTLITTSESVSLFIPIGMLLAGVPIYYFFSSRSKLSNH